METRGRGGGDYRGPESTLVKEGFLKESQNLEGGKEPVLAVWAVSWVVGMQRA